MAAAIGVAIKIEKAASRGGEEGGIGSASKWRQQSNRLAWRGGENGGENVAAAA
jgi:hypothetical protein